MLGRSLNRSIYLSLKNDIFTRFGTNYLRLNRGTSVRLFTATSKLKNIEVISSNNTDNSSNLPITDNSSNLASISNSSISSNIFKTEDEFTREERVFYDKFKRDIGDLSKKKSWRSILNLCEKFKKLNLKPDLSIYNAILHAYIPLGSVECSLRILEDMKLANIKPNLTTYHYLLRTCTQTPQNRQNPHLREQILEMITKDGFQLDLKTYECYIDSLLAGEEYERAFLIFDSLKSKNMYPNMESFIGIIRKAISINEPGIALKYLNELEQNQFVYVPDSLYNDVLRSSAYEYHADGVLHCWNKLKHRGLSLDEGTCIDILYFAGNHGKPDLVLQVVEYLMEVRKLTLRKLHLIPLTQSYVNAGDIKKALESLSIQRNAGFEPTLLDANGIYSLIRKDIKTIDKAYYCLEEIHSEGKKVDVTAFNVIIAACSNIRTRRQRVDVARALETYKTAEKLDVKPNSGTFSALLLVCYNAKQKEVADQLWKEMQELNITPSTSTYYRMIQTICTQDSYEEAFIYLENMKAKNVYPPREIYECIIKKCVISGDTRALLALEEMESLNYKISQSFYDELKGAGFDINLFKENKKKYTGQQKNINQQEMSSNEKSVEKSTPVTDTDAINEFVDMIASIKKNEIEENQENEQKIS